MVPSSAPQSNRIAQRPRKPQESNPRLDPGQTAAAAQFTSEQSREIKFIMPNHISDLWNPELIRKHDLSGPRYTSYPTAPHFQEGFTFNQWQQAAEQSNHTGNPLSLYFHIPFCSTVCYYCACNKIITANRKLAIPYVEALQKEIVLQAQYIDHSRSVDQLHLGGGTPTYLTDEQMTALIESTRQHFNLHSDDSGEYSIEIHPQGVSPERLEHLRNLGFNRLSMGVQDFDSGVQKAVNRFNSYDEVSELVSAARKLGYHSVSLDLIYGLPLQTAESFASTLEKVISIRPDRLSVFNYAHLPELFKTQKQIDANLLPVAQEKLTILYQSIETLLNAGYVYVGMDHFALPNDELAIAQMEKKLHRNFQGYATHGNCDMFSFGVSSIAAFGDRFIQNHKSIEQYYAPLSNNELPLNKGIALSHDDKIRQAVIAELICHFELDYATIGDRFGIEFTQYFADELNDLKLLEDDGLLSMSTNGLKVHNAGRLLIRRICMGFDAYLRQKQAAGGNSPRFSKII